MLSPEGHWFTCVIPLSHISLPNGSVLDGMVIVEEEGAVWGG